MALALSLTFFVVELVAGIVSGSLALLSDSFHLLSDVAGFVISLVAITLAELPATSRYSYGFHRVEILGAILSTSLIWALTAALVWVLDASSVHRRPRRARSPTRPLLAASRRLKSC